MPHDEEQVRQLVRQLYQSAEEAPWDLEPEQVRTCARLRRFHWPEAKVLVLVGAAAALVVIGFAVAVGSGSHSSTAKQSTTPTTLPPLHSTVPPATTAPTVTSPPTTVPATESASLSVISCPTTFGYPTPAPATLPASVTVAVPRSLSGQLSVYSDTQGEMKVVGPSGWTCQAQIGADGSGGVVVSAPGESVPQEWGAGWPLSSDSNIQAIVGIQTSACWGCTLGQACHLFTAAATTSAGQFGGTCSRPPAEAVQQISPGIVNFQDPPAVTGDGIPSGGQNPGNGVMTYYPGNQSGSWLETCTLPTTQKELCTTALNSFIAWYGQN
jgi:hypothetical protein